MVVGMARSREGAIAIVCYCYDIKKKFDGQIRK